MSRSTQLTAWAAPHPAPATAPRPADDRSNLAFAGAVAFRDAQLDRVPSGERPPARGGAPGDRGGNTTRSGAWRARRWAFDRNGALRAHRSARPPMRLGATRWGPSPPRGLPGWEVRRLHQDQCAHRDRRRTRCSGPPPGCWSPPPGSPAPAAGWPGSIRAHSSGPDDASIVPVDGSLVPVHRRAEPLSRVADTVEHRRLVLERCHELESSIRYMPRTAGGDLLQVGVLACLPDGQVGPGNSGPQRLEMSHASIDVEGRVRQVAHGVTVRPTAPTGSRSGRRARRRLEVEALHRADASVGPVR